MSSGCWRSCLYECKRCKAEDTGDKEDPHENPKDREELRLPELRRVQEMTESVIIALITSAVTLFGVILSNSKTSAVTNNEIKHLAEEVQMHNNFARRMPVVEEQIKELSQRIEKLEREVNK